jgi:hypothetical protein
MNVGINIARWMICVRQVCSISINNNNPYNNYFIERLSAVKNLMNICISIENVIT